MRRTRCARNAIAGYSYWRMLAQPFEIDRIQSVLFVIESFEQLFEAARRVGKRTS